MPISEQLLQSVTSLAPQEAWAAVMDHLWAQFSQAMPAAVADVKAEFVRREHDLTELDNALSGSAWDLWEQFESSVPKASQAIVDFWNNTHGGKAVA